MAKEVEKSLISEQGEAQETGNSAGLGPKVILTREQIFERAMCLTETHGEDVEFWVSSIQGAIQAVNGAQL
ncbi:hypothetical protein [Microbulbifer sp. JMSA003]|uniref:hypothetical protein n=1 Tax=unclassified Microbulbifer TaxID=2619833 RepID=UPI00403A3BCF